MIKNQYKFINFLLLWQIHKTNKGEKIFCSIVSEISAHSFLAPLLWDRGTKEDGSIDLLTFQ